MYIYIGTCPTGVAMYVNFFLSFLLVSDGLSPIKIFFWALENIYCFWPSAYKDTAIKCSLRHDDPCLTKRRCALTLVT